MTTRFKDFGTGGSANAEPLSFKLHEEEFHCRPSLQGKSLLKLASAGTGNATAVSESIERFFKDSLLPESYERFQALLDHPEKIVTVEALGEIAGWLTGEYSGRPTQGPEQSASGQQISGPM